MELFRPGPSVSASFETRRSKRKPFGYAALLDFGDGKEPRRCEVQDISVGGARLIVFTDTMTVPETFKLLLCSSAQVQRTCQVAWRSTDEVGVRFIKPTG